MVIVMKTEQYGRGGRVEWCEEVSRDYKDYKVTTNYTKFNIQI